jgi:O-antigen ligase
MISRQINLQLFITLVLLIVTAFFISYIPYLIAVLLTVLLFLLYKKDFAILLIIVVFTAFTGPALKDIRDVVNIFSIVILFYLFLKQFGLNIKLYPQIPKEVFYFMLLFAGTLLLSTFSSYSVGTSFINLIRTFIFFIICYIFYSLIQNKNIIYLYIFSLILTEFIIGVSIQYEFIRAGLSFHLSNGILARFAGIYDNPNVVGLAAFISTSFIISLFFIERFSSRKYRIFFAILLLNSTTVFLITDSRAATIALIISSGFLLYFLNRKLLFKLILFGVSSILILLSIPSIQIFLETLLRLSAVGSRTAIWGAGLQLFSNNILLGVGPGMYPKYGFTYLPTSKILYLEQAGELFRGRPNPHNFFLLMASENGIFGLITAILIFVLFFYLGYKCIKGYQDTDRDYYVLAVSVFGIGLGCFERSFFEVSGIMRYGFITQDLPFWLTFSILVYIYKRLKASKPRDSLPAKIPSL